jgi:hypothetical protein
MPTPYLESYVGIDASVYSENKSFWEIWNAPSNWKSGIALDPHLWDLTESIMKKHTFPKFKYNLFLQYKVPEYILHSRRGIQHDYWKKRPFYRYDLEKHQQDILCSLEKKASKHALVVYACASFYELVNSGQFIENSNYVEPHKVQGRSQYTFIQRGRNGCAFSEPVPVEGVDLLDRIQSMEKQQSSFEDNAQFIYSLEKDIQMVIKDLAEPLRKRLYFIRDSNRSPDHPLGAALVTILSFSLFANVTWAIGYQVNDKPDKELDEELGDERVNALVKNLQ